MSLNTFILTFTSVVNLGLGTTVLLRNYRNRTNQCMFLISFFITAWTVTSYLTDNTSTLELNLMFARLANFTGFQIVFCILLFSYFYPRPIKEVKLNPLFVLSAWIIGSSLPFLSLTIAGVSGNNGVAQQELGPLYALFIVVLLVVFGKAISNLTYRYRHARDRSEAARLKFMIFGFLASFILGVGANAVLPSLTGNWQLSRFGPIFSTILVGAIAAAIIRHKLFDIRWLVARSLAYLLLVTTLIALYTGLIFGLSAQLFEEGSVFSQQILPIIAALFVAATAPFFKKLFDRATNNFFYRDAYDPQVFLDQLNKILVGNIELESLLRQATKVIQENVKCEVCLISVRQVHATDFRVFGYTTTAQKSINMPEVSEELVKIGRKITVIDELEGRHHQLSQALNKHNVMVVCSLSGYEVQQLATAYLLLGPKKSGNVYTKQDMRMLEIISDQLDIAIQNALRYEEIQGFAITLQRKVRAATRDLERSNEKLKALDEAKDDFISMASHQLRTPLTSVKGYLSLVMEGDAGKLTTKQHNMINQAYFSAQRMVYIISDLLNVSRLRTGKFVIDASPVNLKTVVREELEQLHDIAKSRSVKLSCDVPESFPELMLDETKTRQIIMNLVDNAIYYTPAGGSVNVSLSNLDHTVELRVKDTGIGVPKSEQPHLFTKFYRAGNARQVRPDGTGLGLFMAKKVIIAQGGAIIFESKPEKGSTFGFVLSKAKLSPEKPYKIKAAD